MKKIIIAVAVVLIAFLTYSILRHSEKPSGGGDHAPSEQPAERQVRGEHVKQPESTEEKKDVKASADTVKAEKITDGETPAPAGEATGEVEQVEDVQPAEATEGRDDNVVVVFADDQGIEAGGENVRMAGENGEKRIIIAAETPSGDIEYVEYAEYPPAGAEQSHEKDDDTHISETEVSSGETDKKPETTLPRVNEAERPRDETAEAEQRTLLDGHAEDGQAGDTSDAPAEELTPLLHNGSPDVDSGTPVVPTVNGEEEGSDREMPPAVRTETPKSEEKERIALYPFDNFGNDTVVLDLMIPVLKDRLEEKGFTVVSGAGLNDFLCEHRIREAGYVSGDIALRIGRQFRVKTVLTGAVVSSSTDEKNPQIGLLARLIDSSTGSMIWAEYISVSGGDFTGILGLGRIKDIESLVPKAVDALLKSFSTVQAGKGTETPYKIAVLRFRNKSGTRGAGMITTYLFLVELLKNRRFEPIEYGSIRDLIVKHRIRNRGELNYNNIEALSNELGVRGILVGTIESYRKGTDSSTPPLVAVTSRLLDAGRNSILWYNSHHLEGKNRIIAFEWEEVRSADEVAHEVVSELIRKMEAADIYR